MSRIKKIETWACHVPLDHPIRFRWNTIDARDYTVVRLETDDGHVGSAIGISRKQPIDVAVTDIVAPVLLGKEAMEVGAFQDDLRQATASHDQFGILGLARSLVDIALWDIKGKILGAPLWQLLGGNSKPAPVLLVEGYELPDETDEDFAKRLTERVQEGYQALKLEAAGYEDPQVLRRRLELVREYAGDGVALIVDVNGAWRSVREAAETINSFSGTNLAWVEDPFPRHRIGDIGKLRREVDVALSAGDDITNPMDLIRLVEDDAVDVLRVDMTTLGGVSATADVVGAARQREIPVSTHAHSSIHQHVTFAWPNTTYVEAFPDNRPFEPSSKLLMKSVFGRVERGMLEAPVEPGLDLDLDLAAVNAFAVRHDAVPLD